MQIKDTPVPSLQKGHILVKTHYSIISVGTEGSTVKTARKGFIGKAKERPHLPPYSLCQVGRGKCPRKSGLINIP